MQASIDNIQKLTNEGCREQALANAKLGNYQRAMRWYNSAAARTIGHKKPTVTTNLRVTWLKQAALNTSMNSQLSRIGLTFGFRGNRLNPNQPTNRLST